MSSRKSHPKNPEGKRFSGSQVNHSGARAPVIHAALQASTVMVDVYNSELRAPEGFAGDRASKRAFDVILDDWRDRLRRVDSDPLAEEDHKAAVSKKRLDQLLAGENLEAAALVLGVIEEFSHELAAVVRRFLRLKNWEDTAVIVVGGGLRASRVGELSIARAQVLLNADNLGIKLVPIRNHPDEAGLIGCAHLAPTWMLKGHDAILAVDVGGTNIRAGIVELNLKKAPDLTGVRVSAYELWRHREEDPTREEAVARLVKMLSELAQQAQKEKLRLAPFIGIGCPGLINEDGSVERGGQNLPGNWESRRFHLPSLIVEAIPTLGDNDTMVVMHNDAVVQGLSEAPFMIDVERWGVLTIGTGLGNARFTNRHSKPAAKA
jgi:predicted NBD/HSP70 family sugar kinase